MTAASRRLLRANVRVPHQTMGDFDAQMAANAIGAARLRELAARYGTETVTAVMAALQDYSEQRMRAAIRAVPDGIYHGEDAGRQRWHRRHEAAGMRHADGAG